MDAATQLTRSTLPEFKKTKVKLLFASAELDPGINGSMSAFYQTLHDELCKEGADHCRIQLGARDPDELLASRHNRHRAALLRQTSGQLARVRAYMRAAPANQRGTSGDAAGGGSLTGSSRERPIGRATASKPSGFIEWSKRWLRQGDDFQS